MKPERAREEALLRSVRRHSFIQNFFFFSRERVCCRWKLQTERREGREKYKHCAESSSTTDHSSERGRGKVQAAELTMTIVVDICTVSVDANELM